MSTGIEWTDETWNPATGCTKVSPGCDHCYAERITNRFGGPGAFDTVMLHPKRLEQPLRWRKPRRVFVNSMSDLFHDDIPDEFIAQVFAVMALTPQHTYQILTKRHGRMRALLTAEWFWMRVDQEMSARSEIEDVWYEGVALPNVWLGVSVEDQKRADLRIPALLDTPAAIRFVSCEPLLGPVDLEPYVDWWHAPCRGTGMIELAIEPWQVQCGCVLGSHTQDRTRGLDWVIVGGESGPGARPMHPDWARALRDQCQAAGVSFFFKQWGEWASEHRPETEVVLNSLGPSEAVAAGGARGGHVLYRRVGKKRAGRELDGRVHDEFPGELVRA